MMIVKNLLVFVVCFLIVGCAANNHNMIDEIAEVNSRPFVADTMQPRTHVALTLPPLSVSGTKYDSLIAMDKERRSYRKMLILNDQEINADVMVSNSLLKALKASELEQRATERMAIRYKYELENEKKTAIYSDIGHRLSELILFIMFVVK